MAGVTRVPRWVFVVVVVALAVAVADVAVFRQTRRHAETASAAPAAPTTGMVSVIDPKHGSVVAQIDVGRQPTKIGAGFGGVWVLNHGDGTLTHIDPRRRTVITTLTPDAVANDLTVGVGGVWFVGHPRTMPTAPLTEAWLERLSGSGRVDRSFRTSTGASAVAAGGGALWSTGLLTGHVRGSARSDAETGAMRRLEIGIYGDLVAADDSAAYYVASIGNRVARLDVRTGRVTNTLELVSDATLAAGRVPADPTTVVVGGGAVWISETDGTLLRIDPRLRRIQETIHVCRNALAVAYGEAAAWVACSDGSVVPVDPATNTPGRPIRVGRLPRGIAAGEGGVWVTLE
jgi:streptogramin lyase